MPIPQVPRLRLRMGPHVTMLISRKRLRQWCHVLSLVSAGAPWYWRAWAFCVAGFKMTRAVLSGPVPREVWRHRMRVCAKCPVYDRVSRACMKKQPSGITLGCGCFTPFQALTAAPYKEGCWARAIGVVDEGWPAHRYSSLANRILTIVRFIVS